MKCNICEEDQLVFYNGIYSDLTGKLYLLGESSYIDEVDNTISNAFYTLFKELYEYMPLNENGTRKVVPWNRIYAYICEECPNIQIEYIDNTSLKGLKMVLDNDYTVINNVEELDKIFRYEEFYNFLGSSNNEDSSIE